MHLLFGSPTHKNYKVKCACLGVILGWVTSWEVFPGSARVRTKRAGKTRVVTVRPFVKSGCYNRPVKVDFTLISAFGGEFLQMTEPFLLFSLNSRFSFI